MTVVIADAAAVVRKRLRALLEEDPLLAVAAEAASAWEAVVLCQSRAPAALVVDLDLPDASGLDVLRVVKARAPWCAVVVLTSHHQDWVREECRRRGADAVFHKATEFEGVPLFLHTLADPFPGVSLPASETIHLED